MSATPAFQVIGAGLPRTGESPAASVRRASSELIICFPGTASLKEALEILGFNPTLHMFELWQSAELSKQWMHACARIADGEKNVDLRPLVAGFGSGVDTPVSDVFIELAEQFPQAKVRLAARLRRGALS